MCACRDKVGGVKVAVKALPPELSHNSVKMEEVRENFELVVGLRHPNIAGVRTLEQDERGEYFLVMDVAEGVSLRKWLREKRKAGGVSLEEAVGVLRQVAAALDYAHGEKVVHRDVKPGNVMIDGRGRVKVLDFGLAAQIRSSLSRASRAFRGTSGTGPYMAPEQWEAQPQDGQADQYALGAMAYEMLSGHLPFESTELAVLKEAALKGDIRDIPGVGKRIMKAIRRAMAKDPKARWSSCVEFVDALAGRKTKRRRRKHGRGGLLLVALAVLAGIGAWVWHAVDPKGSEAAWDTARIQIADAWERIPGLGGAGHPHSGGVSQQPLAVAAKDAAERARAEASEASGLPIYKTGEGRFKTAEEAFARADYPLAKSEWDSAVLLYAQAQSQWETIVKDEAKQNARDAEENARAAQSAAEKAPGGRERAEYKEGEALVAAAQTLKLEDKYKEAGEKWREAEDKFRTARDEAGATAKAKAKEAASAAGEDARKARAAAEKAGADLGEGSESFRMADELLKTGHEAYKKEDFAEAGNQWRTAAETFREAEEKAVRMTKFTAAMTAARNAEKSEWWEEVIRQTETALALYPHHAEAESMLKNAQTALNSGGQQVKPDVKERPAGEVKWVWLPNGGELELVWCPPGAPGPDGSLLPGFWMGRTEVTQGQWERLMGATVLHEKERGVRYGAEEDWPVRAVSWAECVDFCEEMNKATGTGHGWRLPLEAEWKWASEAGGTGFGTAWYRDNSGGHVHRVREGQPNGWGLFDMRGNVEEWCLDRWGKDSIGREFRVIRGGAFNSGDPTRRWGREGTPDPLVGFRVCLEDQVE